MIFRQLNPHSCKTYLIGQENSNEVALIDPVLEHLNEYLELLKQENFKLRYVIDTHTHADHISGCSALKDLTDSEYVMHTKAPAHCVGLRVDDGFEWNIGDIPVKVMHTPGHTIDSMCLILPDRIMTGDTLFLDDGGAGRDDLPGGDPGAHWESLKRIMELPNNLIVYPAHDYRNRTPSSLANQKITNPHLKPRSKQDFVKYLDDLKLVPAEWMKDVLKTNYACARDPKSAWVPVDAAACEIKGTLEHGVNDMQVTDIPAEELKQKLDTDRSPVLLDVRENKELIGELGHLPGIKHIPIGSLTDRLSELEENKDKEIVTMCRSGGRSHTAAQILMQAGFNHVYNLEGGMSNWNKLGYSVEK